MVQFRAVGGRESENRTAKRGFTPERRIKIKYDSFAKKVYKKSNASWVICVLRRSKQKTSSAWVVGDP